MDFVDQQIVLPFQSYRWTDKDMVQKLDDRFQNDNEAIKKWLFALSRDYPQYVKDKIWEDYKTVRNKGLCQSISSEFRQILDHYNEDFEKTRVDRLKQKYKTTEDLIKACPLFRDGKEHFIFDDPGDDFYYRLLHRINIYGDINNFNKSRSVPIPRDCPYTLEELIPYIRIGHIYNEFEYEVVGNPSISVLDCIYYSMKALHPELEQDTVYTLFKKLNLQHIDYNYMNDEDKVRWAARKNYLFYYFSPYAQFKGINLKKINMRYCKTINYFGTKSISKSSEYDLISRMRFDEYKKRLAVALDGFERLLKGDRLWGEEAKPFNNYSKLVNKLAWGRVLLLEANSIREEAINDQQGLYCKRDWAEMVKEVKKASAGFGINSELGYYRNSSDLFKNRQKKYKNKKFYILRCVRDNEAINNYMRFKTLSDRQQKEERDQWNRKIREERFKKFQYDSKTERRDMKFVKPFFQKSFFVIIRDFFKLFYRVIFKSCYAYFWCLGGSENILEVIATFFCIPYAILSELLILTKLGKLWGYLEDKKEWKRQKKELVNSRKTTRYN